MWHLRPCLQRVQPPVTWPNTARRSRVCYQGYKGRCVGLLRPTGCSGSALMTRCYSRTTSVEEDEFDTDDDDDMEEAEDEAGDDVPPLAIDVWLFMWPAPLSPARVRIVPDIEAVANDTASDLSVSFGVSGDECMVEALSTSCGVAPGDLLPALSALGLACWSAHQADEHGEDDDDAEDEGDDAYE